MEHLLLPDMLTLPLTWAGLLLAATGTAAISLQEAVWGAALGYGSLWAVFWGFKLATGKEGLGYGDFKLVAAFGAWFGVLPLLPIVGAASILGATAGLFQMLRKGKSEVMPFGPALALAASGYLFVFSLRHLTFR